MSRVSFSVLPRYALRTLTAVVLMFIGLASCTSVDDKLGAGFIPGEQYLSIAIDSSFQIKTYNVTTDSVRTEGISSTYLGGYHHPSVGTANAGIVFQMGIPYFSSDEMLGTNPVIDSMTIAFGLAGAFGDTDVDQVFDIYKLTEDIYVDSSYYNNFDVTSIIEPTPFISFTYTYNKFDEYISYRITDEDLKTELADTSGYWSNEAFHKRFKGFYITPRIPHNDAAVYNVSLTNSYLVAYYHNFNEEPDTSLLLYRFAPNSTSYIGDNQNINIVNYDYSTADPALRIDDKSTPVSQVFVQGYGGISTYMEFTKESVEAIKAKIAAAGYSHIAINKARLEVPFVQRDPDMMDKHFSRLGMYHSLTQFEPIVDYDYETETLYGYTISYGGYINRSRYIYEMDITRYVLSLFNSDNLGEENDGTGVILAPATTDFASMNVLGLNGYGASDPMKLIITYTMIK